MPGAFVLFGFIRARTTLIKDTRALQTSQAQLKMLNEVLKIF